MNVARVAHRIKQQFKMLIRKHVEPAGNGRVPGQHSSGARLDFYLDTAGLEPGEVGHAIDGQHIAFTIDRAVDGAASFRVIDEKAILVRARGRELQIGLHAAEESRLGMKWTTLFRAHHIAITAFIASVGEVGKLMLLDQLEQTSGHAAYASGRPFEVIVKNGAGGRMVNKIRVIRTDGYAFVATDAIVKPELRADLPWDALIAFPLISWIFSGLFDQRSGVQIACRIDQRLLQIFDAKFVAD